ncbi:hypothetical protein HZH66_007444 [Vespula vulgaris]|uniref:Uncharacterized protein n=1 Tax=Vespula vulgaris TaxID=7454 RepID=A0A834JZP4_VESVU|nr:hypothetical protein HZH66_007444 [Vespula vulgaris]
MREARKRRKGGGEEEEEEKEGDGDGDGEGVGTRNFTISTPASKSTNLSVRVFLGIDLRDIANGFPDVL